MAAQAEPYSECASPKLKTMSLKKVKRISEAAELAVKAHGFNGNLNQLVHLHSSE